MCIGFPGKITAIDQNRALIEIGGVTREIWLDIVDEEVAVGDYVICHAGFAIHRIDEELAREKLSVLTEIIEHESY